MMESTRAQSAACPGRELETKEIGLAVAALCREANYALPRDVIEACRRGLRDEESPQGREVLDMIIENATIASREMIPLCQDTGLVTVFLEVGQGVRLTGPSLEDAIQAGVSRGYTEGYLRPSMVADPFRRINTKDNTPAVIHTRIVPGEKVRVVVAPKGGGSENMSALAMLTPADGRDGVKRFVIETVRRAGPNPCPPILVGVGVGGNFEQVALLAKKALLRPLGRRHPEKFYADLEEELLEAVNKEGIGPMGMGGRVTAFDVHLECSPCHIACLPVAVSINCHSIRRREMVL
jgi:fumarate hydratase subunit alpha